MKTIKTSKIVNVSRFVVRNNNNEYLSSLNGNKTNNINNAYLFKNLRRAKFFAKKYRFNFIVKCNVEIERKMTTINLEIGDSLNEFLSALAA